MSLDSGIVVVSGLPRSGTSLLMQMLDRGGILALTDEIRAADPDNPRGYYEFERVKQTKKDPSWLAQARGKAVKMVSSLLYDLPASENYRVVFMQRDMDEILESQEKMLRRLGRPTAPRDQMKASFAVHLDRVSKWLASQPNFRVLYVSYNQLLSSPESETNRVCEFLDRHCNAGLMLAAIDTSLYRNRKEVVQPT
jgi:hypothetical protein